VQERRNRYCAPLVAIGADEKDKNGTDQDQGSMVDWTKKARQDRQDRFDVGKREVAITSRSHASRRMCSQ
jgi:hypothetical protein